MQGIVASRLAKDSASFAMYAPFRAGDVTRTTLCRKKFILEAARCTPTMLDLDFVFLSG
jgi:hypothetical protein